ncbi:MAG: hypothetical protein KTR13_05530 [Saprospiraceae bacterium]|nr:hypothetical protein [Saprospiraceae bacterium]
MSEEKLKYSEEAAINLGWEKMDEVLKEKGPRKRFPWWIIPLLLGLMVATYFLLPKPSITSDLEDIPPVVFPKEDINEKKTESFSNPAKSGETDLSADETQQTKGLSSELSNDRMAKGDPTSNLASGRNSSVSSETTSRNVLKDIGGQNAAPISQNNNYSITQEVEFGDGDNMLIPFKESTVTSSVPDDPFTTASPSEESKENSAQTEQPSAKTNEPRPSLSEAIRFSEKNDNFSIDATEELDSIVHQDVQQHLSGDEDIEEPLAVEVKEILDSLTSPTKRNILDSNLQQPAVWLHGHFITRSFDFYGGAGGIEYVLPISPRSKIGIGAQASSIRDEFEQILDAQALFSNIDSIEITGNQRVHISEIALPIQYQLQLSDKITTSIGIHPAYQRITEANTFSDDEVAAVDNSTGIPLTIDFNPGTILPQDQFTLSSRLGLSWAASKRLELSSYWINSFGENNSELDYSPAMIYLGMRFRLQGKQGN